jgi:large subunit ribosomal protein L22
MARSKTVQSKTAEVKTAEAHAMGLRLSPRKARLVTNLVKGLPALDAIEQLRFTNKKASKYVIDLLRSAVANAEHNFKLDADRLYIKTITCDMGPKLKRYMPRAQGKASEIRKPTSHLHVILEERLGAKKSKIQKSGAPSTGKHTAVKETASITDEDPNKAEQKASAEHGKIAGKPSQAGKSSERVKSNKVTQKRRLFNRKSGV